MSDNYHNSSGAGPFFLGCFIGLMLAGIIGIISFSKKYPQMSDMHHVEIGSEKYWCKKQ